MIQKRDDSLRLMRRLRDAYDENARKLAIECGATTEEEIARLTAWEVVVDGVRYGGNAAKLIKPKSRPPSEL